MRQFPAISKAFFSNRKNQALALVSIVTKFESHKDLHASCADDQSFFSMLAMKQMSEVDVERLNPVGHSS